MTHIDDVIRQKQGMVEENICFRKCLSDPVTQLHPWSKFDNNNVKRLRIEKKVSKVVIFPYFLHKTPIYRPFYKNIVNYPPQPHLKSKPRFFWTSRPICWLLDKSQLSPPLDFFFDKGGTFGYWWMWPLWSNFWCLQQERDLTTERDFMKNVISFAEI